MSQGGDLFSIMPQCMVSKSEQNGSFFWLKRIEMDEKMSFRMGAKSLLQCIWVRIFQMYGMFLCAKVLEVKYNQC